MAGKRDVHTVPNPSGSGWINKVGGQATGTVYRTQAEAKARGREIARQEQSEHSVHGRDGQIRAKNSYGNDPNPPRDENR